MAESMDDIFFEDSTVHVGIPKKSTPAELKSCYFPSKIGGKPAWLDPENLPSREVLQCKVCKKQMIFLCQIYAPYEEDERNFHRTIFVFFCRNRQCWVYNSASNYLVLRNNLPRINKFYSGSPVDEDEKQNLEELKWTNVCNFCGCRGYKPCSNCATVYYCCDEHQEADAKVHQKNCGSDGSANRSNWQLLFPQYKIEIEDEISNPENVYRGEDYEMQQLAKFQRSKRYEFARSLKNNDKEDIENSDETEEALHKFKERIIYQPAQVIRYDRGKVPLSIVEKPPKLIGSVPPFCSYCNGSSQFEFQIMPQLICLLKDYAIDFAMLNIYTCKNSCVPGEAYKQEIIVKDDFKKS